MQGLTEPGVNQYNHNVLLYYLMGIGAMTLCSLGIIGNALSIIVLTRRVMRSSTYSYLTALAISDTFFLLFTMIICLRDTKKPVRNEFQTVEPYYAYLFPYIHPLAVTFQITSIWLTMAFTVDRYIMICHPFKAERWCSVNRARKVIIGLTLAGVLFNLVRFFEYRTVERDDNTVDIDLAPLGKGDTFRMVVHSWLYLTCVAGIPFLSLLILNIFLIRAVHESRKKGREINAKEKRRNDTTVMLIGVIVIFLICQGPALISRMIWAFELKKAVESVPLNTFNEVSNFLVIVNSAINIVPYYFFGKKFRKQFWRLFCKCILSKDELRRLTRSLSLSIDRRQSNAGHVELNHLEEIQHSESYKKFLHKYSIAIPLIDNGMDRSPSPSGDGLYHTDDLMKHCEQDKDGQRKLRVQFESNGNCEVKVDTCGECQNSMIL
ncbi:hypothetical protein FSP39_005393 [Pinctada imbricata]|uniref:G-protein coupled receptors family 1 profile domain-containing protein n=1 Tax=Pinctada imbricata TaxID=66713 RepID=A0AA88YAF6_PINIB|nr:hypothetical protein FSP39_005393 [Pinctada imbricata]